MATTDIRQVNIRLMLGRLRPDSEYWWVRDGIDPTDVDFGNTTASIRQWRDNLTVQPTEAEIMAEWDVYQAEQAQLATDENAVRTKVLTMAASAVGIAVDQLTTAQVRALFAILLWKNGALNPNGTIKPLNQWVK